LRYGFVAAAFRGSDLEGILFANLSAPEYPRVSRLWASSERRGGDIAAALVYAACTELAGRGAVAASAWVAQRDVAARRVLTRVGWRPWLLWKKVLLRQ